MLAPIVLFVYNRPWHTNLTLEALKKNLLAESSILYIFSDGPQKVSYSSDITKIEEVRNLIRSDKWCEEVKIFESNYNKGLAKSQIQGISRIFDMHDKVIVLEDDLITSPYFLKFMNESLDYYKTDKNIFTVTGTNINPKYFKLPFFYVKDLFIVPRTNSTGWGTWKDRWETVDWDIQDYAEFMNTPYEMKKFEKGGRDLTELLKQQFEGKIDSWAVRWAYAAYKQNKQCVYPRHSYTSNIGFDEFATHTKSKSDLLCNDINLARKNIRLVKLKKSNLITNRFIKVFDYSEKKTFFFKIKILLLNKFPFIRKLKYKLLIQNVKNLF